MKITYFCILITIFQSSFLFTVSDRNKLAKDVVAKAKKGDFSLVSQYAKKEANFDFRDHEGKSILMYAAEYDKPEVIRFLSTQQIDPNLTNNENFTALMIASKKHHNNSIKELMKINGIKINLQGKHGKTALDWAHDSKNLYAEQVKEIKDTSKFPIQVKNTIKILTESGGKSANELQEKK